MSEEALIGSVKAVVDVMLSHAFQTTRPYERLKQVWGNDFSLSPGSGQVPYMYAQRILAPTTGIVIDLQDLGPNQLGLDGELVTVHAWGLKVTGELLFVYFPEENGWEDFLSGNGSLAVPAGSSCLFTSGAGWEVSAASRCLALAGDDDTATVDLFFVGMAGS